MKNSMQKIVLSALTGLLATVAVSPMAEAAEMNHEGVENAPFNVHQVRIAEFDARNKNFDIKEGFSVHETRLMNLDRRNKAGDSLKTTSLMQQRFQVLDRGGYK